MRYHIYDNSGGEIAVDSRILMQNDFNKVKEYFSVNKI